MTQNDYYQILGVERDADPRKIKEAYRRLAFEYHPDRNRGNTAALEKMKELNEAYAVLSDAEKRSRYDGLRQEYGSHAHDRFRQGYSEEDIFRGSDINQIFEEMARNFGFRRSDEVFSEFYGQGYRTFEFRRPGVFGKVIFFGSPRAWQNRSSIPPQAGPLPGLFGKLAGYLLKKALGVQQSSRQRDQFDVITIDEGDALHGAKVSYIDRTTSRQLIIKIPQGVKDGQTIRLRGVAQGSANGDAAAGDLYLEVRFRKSLFERFKTLLQKSREIKRIH